MPTQSHKGHNFFYIKNPHSNYGDKKPWYIDLLESLTLIKYLLSSIYTLIHVHHVVPLMLQWISLNL